MPTITEAIKNFLLSVPHNGRDLIDRYVERYADMETQINVVTTGEQVRRGVWTDGINEWRNIRIPRNAATKPEFTDGPMTYCLSEFAEAIGSTGWDWAHRRSRWFGFDFDSIAGHAAGVGISEEQLERVREAAQALDVVEVRRSTGGKGLHLYVFTDGIETQNHTEHAALARAVLGMLGSAAGFDFARHIDACGGNMWLWHRKMTEQNQGLSLVKQAARILTAADLPSKWREQTHKRTKVVVDLASQQSRVELGDRHEATIDAIRDAGVSVIWVPEHQLLQTHTVGLQRVHDAGGIRGHFATNSRGTDLGEPNCFLFPLHNGGWKVYRFSSGTTEHESWKQDGAGWTWTYYDRPCDLATAAEAVEAVEAKKGYVATFKQLSGIARMMDHPFVTPDVSERDIRITARIDGRIDVSMQWREGDPSKLKGWYRQDKKWESVIGKPPVMGEPAAIEVPDIVRCLSTEAGIVGYCIWTPQHHWQNSARPEAISHLVAHDVPEPMAKRIIGKAVGSNYRLVIEPFASEYPRPFHWNRFAPQLAFQPAEQDGEWPHYKLVLDHVGKRLAPAVQESNWCADRGISDGADYLMYWAAYMFRHPFRRLPALFLFGPQNCGKSTFHEMLTMLMTRGAKNIDKLFLRGNTFDAELDGTLLGVIEEADITGKNSRAAYNRIKDLVLSETIAIEPKGLNAYTQKNILHLIHTANEAGHCPILDSNDTRFVCVEVEPLSKAIAAENMKSYLMQEAPNFLRHLHSLPLPETQDSDSRLALPPLYSECKAKVIAAAKGEQILESPARGVARVIAPTIRALVRVGRLQQVTASRILNDLRALKIEPLPKSPEVIGQALGCITGLKIVRGKSNGHRWITAYDTAYESECIRLMAEPDADPHESEIQKLTLLENICGVRHTARKA